MDWTLRHGRASALQVALKESPELIWEEQYKIKLQKTVLSQLSADKIVITMAAIRSYGYLLQHLLLNGEMLPVNILGPFVKVRNLYF